jgi:ribose 5-phosphate isomerase B
VKIAIGADHRGYHAKADVIKVLQSEKIEVIDAGTFNSESCDYPNIARVVADKVAGKEVDLGILICQSGNGMAITANKIRGIRAALCYSLASAELSKQHNDANVLVLGTIELKDPLDIIVKSWIKTKFEGGRHKRRVDQITQIEQEESLR